MKYSLIKPVFVCFIVAFSALFSTATLAKNGQLAPDFSINDKQRLSDLKGKVVYLDFWASWCGPCRKSFPWMNDLTTKYSDDELVVISVNLDSEMSQAQKFLSKYPAKFSVTYNPEGDIAEQYKVMGMPSSYLIDREGRIAKTHIGFFSKKAAKYEKQIDQLVKRGKP